MANLITLARLPLLILIVGLFASPSPVARLITVPLLVLLIVMDTLDGMVARRRHEVSLMGSVLDIVVDRAVELVLWVCYGYYRLIPLAIPIIYILRGTIVDGLRSVGVSEGQAPFKTLRTDVGKWLVGSPWMRSSYGITKGFAFGFLAITHALNAYVARNAAAPSTASTLGILANVLSWVAVALCLARGLPVVVEALPRLRPQQPGA